MDARVKGRLMAWRGGLMLKAAILLLGSGGRREGNDNWSL
jgi:hypothetical protein